MLSANYLANIGQVNDQLGREVVRAMRKAKMTTPALAKRTGLGESWIKQLRTGRIQKPNAEWLTKVADELGVDPAEWLALSNQLGAATERQVPLSRLPERDLLLALERQTKALETLTSRLDLLLFGPMPESPDREAALAETQRIISEAARGPRPSSLVDLLHDARMSAGPEGVRRDREIPQGEALEQQPPSRKRQPRGTGATRE